MEMISSPRSSQESNGGGQNQQQSSSVFSGYAQQISGHNRPFNSPGDKEQQPSGTTGDLFHRSQVNLNILDYNTYFF